MWVSLKRDDGQPLVARVKAWNHRSMSGIYENFIENEIRHRIESFAERGGDTSKVGFNIPLNYFNINLNIDNSDRHRALFDAVNTAIVMIKCLEILQNKGIYSISNL